ncbi:MAG: hypothetical protein Q7T86_17280 [Hyphomicrobiaceae bacterium]|nr:hypothetical protein [Hyphomicrobiaceae bacterium]
MGFREDAWKDAERKFDEAEAEVRSLFFEETLERLNCLTHPHHLDLWGNIQLFRKLAIYVVTHRAGRGDFLAYLQRERTVGLKLLPKARKHAEAFRAVLQELLDDQLFDDFESIVWDIELWILDCESIENDLKARPTVRGAPGLRQHRMLVFACAYVWKVTKGEPPPTTLEGAFYQYVLTVTEMLPADCRPNALSAATVLDWTKQYCARTRE